MLTKQETENLIENIKTNDPRFNVQNITQTPPYFDKFEFMNRLRNNAELKLIKMSIYLDHNGKISSIQNDDSQNFGKKVEISLYECGVFYILPYYHPRSNLLHYWIGTKNTKTHWSLAKKSFSSDNSEYSLNIVKAIKPLSTVGSLERLDLKLGIRYLKDPELVNKIAEIIKWNQKIGFLNLELNVPDIKPILDQLCPLTNLKELGIYNYSWTKDNIVTFKDFWKSEERKSSINSLDLGNLNFINPLFTDEGNIQMSDLLYILFIWRNNYKELKRLNIKCGAIESGAFHRPILENSEQCFLEELGIFSSEKLPEGIRKHVVEIWENNKNFSSLLTNEEDLCFKRGDAKFAMKKFFIPKLMTISQSVYEEEEKSNHFAGNRDIAFSILSFLGKIYEFNELAVQLCITSVLNHFEERNKNRQENRNQNWRKQSIFSNNKEPKAAENQKIKTIGFCFEKVNNRCGYF